MIPAILGRMTPGLWVRAVAGLLPYKWRLFIGALLVVGLVTGTLIPVFLWFVEQVQQRLMSVVGPAFERIGDAASARFDTPRHPFG